MDDGHRYRDQSSQPVRALLGRRRLAESRESTRRVRRRHMTPWATTAANVRHSVR